MKRTLFLLTVLLVMVVVIPSTAHAGCEGYVTYPHICTATAGCSVRTTSCWFGCISGTCVQQGGSGLCCGTIYYTAIIYPDGFWEQCPSCSEVPRLLPKKVSRNHTPVQFWGGGTPGLIQLGEGSFRLDRQWIAANHCAHTYDASATR